MHRNTLIRLLSATLMLATLTAGTTVSADPLAPINPNAGATQDFENRRNAPGVFYSNGFDTHLETITGNEIRGTGVKSGVLLSNGLQPVPNNRQSDGHYYPAFDASQAASGGGSLRLTANKRTSADHSGGWYHGSTPQNCTGGCEDWPQTFGEQSFFTVSYRVRRNAALHNFDWSSTGGESLKMHIIFRDGGSCSDLEHTLTINKSSGMLNLYSNCAGQLTRYGIVGNTCNACGNTFDYPFFGPAINTGSANASYWSIQSPQAPPNGYKYASSYTSEGAYDVNIPKMVSEEWVWFYFEVKVGKRKAIANCNAWNDADCSHLKAYVSFGDGDSVKQFIDYQWPWQINQAGKSFQNIMFTIYQTGKDFANNSGNEHRWYDELIMSSQAQPLPANLDLASGGGGSGGPTVDNLAPRPPSQLIIEQ